MVQLWISEPRLAVLLACIVSVGLVGIAVALLVRRIDPAALDLPSFVALASVAGVPALILLALPIFLLASMQHLPLDFAAIFTILGGAAIAAIILLNRGLPHWTGSQRAAMTLIVLLCALAALRLPFIQDLVLPPYFDSPEHYQIVNDVLHPERQPAAFYQLSRISTRYYHFGFHALAGCVAAISGAPIEDVLLVLGQVLQVIIPMGLFVPVRAVTHSNAGGIFAVILAGVAWRMPAFASNWGKYPALTGIICLLFALGVLSLGTGTGTRRTQLALLAIAGAGAVLCAQAHTRSLLLLMIALVGWALANAVVCCPLKWQAVAGMLLIGLAAWLAAQIRASPGLGFMVEPYVRSGLMPTVLVLLLGLFGLRTFRREALASILLLLGILVCAALPPPAVFVGYGYTTLLDRPYGQLVLFLPLSLLGGVGFAGLRETLIAQRDADFLHKILPAAGALLIGIIALHAARHSDFLPSPCCQLATADDVAAFGWIQRNLPADAIILIAGNRTPTRIYGVDGGLWITPLTGRDSELWPYGWRSDTIEMVQGACATGATHVYIGATPMRFSVDMIQAKPEWYRLMYSRGPVAVYEMSVCREPGGQMD